MATLDEMMSRGVGDDSDIGIASDRDFLNAFSGNSVSKGKAFQSRAKEKPKKLSTWQWISKQLMKPIGAVAAESENLGNFLGTGEGEMFGKSGLKVLAGKEENSFSDIWIKNSTGIGMSKKNAGVLGLVFDIAGDPLNFLGGGLTKFGALSNKVKSVEKAGKTIKLTGRGKVKELFLGKDLATQIKESGYTLDQLRLAGTKGEQVAKGQRALVQFMGKPVIKGRSIYDRANTLAEIASASKIGTMTRHAFSTKTGIKELDDMITNTKNLSQYRKENIITKAVEIQNDLSKMKPDETKLIIEAIENPVARESIKDKNIINAADKLDGLFKEMKTAEKNVDLLKGEINNYFPHIKSKEKLSKRVNDFFNPKKYGTALGAAKGRKLEGTIAEINNKFGKEFFQNNPTLAYAHRGLASAKAVTAKEFLIDVGKKFFVNAEDAPIRFIESTNPLFKGMVAEPEVVRAVDKYMTGIKPDELKTIIKGFDNVQNWWKAQVLISPAYHSRNMFSNFWNNWLAGVKNPALYKTARDLQADKNMSNVKIITDAGERVTGKTLKEEARKNGVIGKGLYGSDIEAALKDRITPLSKRAKEIGGWMPWKQDNVLFKTNRSVGEAIEDNARLANYIHQRQTGLSPEDAATMVKKYLFDYDDLSDIEKNVLKRVLPFYTWTRKNIPLQLEQMILQPEKYSAVPKIISAWESGVPDPEEEKYMSSYIKDNVPIKMRKNDKGNVEYFLLGNWLPSASAIDFLSQPFDNIVNMATPLVKTPIELFANKSLFFKNTLGESSNIENYYKEPTEFVGEPMRKKTAHLLRNIRILNDINKLTKTPAADEPENSNLVKLADVFFGKAAEYDIEKSAYFYKKDTVNRIAELKASIGKAERTGNEEQADKLRKELEEFAEERFNK